MFSVEVGKNISQLGMNLWLKTSANLIKSFKFRQSILLFLDISWEKVSLRRFPVLSELCDFVISQLAPAQRVLMKDNKGKKGTRKCPETTLAWILTESISFSSYHHQCLLVITHDFKWRHRLNVATTCSVVFCKIAGYFSSWKGRLVSFSLEPIGSGF